MDAARIQALLPWRYPFLMIDRLLVCTPHDFIAMIKRVTAADPVVGGSEMAGTWFPAMLLFEGMSQSAALLYTLSYGNGGPVELPLLGFFDGHLEGSAAVGESVRYDVRSQKMTRTAGVFSAEAHAAERRIARAELAFAMARDEEGPKT